MVFPPLEFMEKLAFIIPPPRIHLTRYHGILAPHSKHRKLVVPERKQPEEMTNDIPGGKSLAVDDDDGEDLGKGRRISWAKLLSRVFAIDMSQCDRCGGEMKAIAAVLKKEAITKILTHLGYLATAPPISQSSIPRQEELDFNQTQPQYEEFF